jgi:hypothetical protein
MRQQMKSPLWQAKSLARAWRVTMGAMRRAGHTRSVIVLD